MTTKTPYDAEAREDLPYNSVSMRLAKARREAYLRARADMQPRIDALLAALAGLLPYAERGIVEWMATPQDEEDVPGKLNALWSLVDIARAALKLAEGPPTP